MPWRRVRDTERGNYFYGENENVFLQKKEREKDDEKDEKDEMMKGNGGKKF